MFAIAVKLLLAYLLGCCLGSELMRRALGGADIRGAGSGNAGATNALRTRGPKYAVGVLLIDLAKGLVAVSLLPLLPWGGEILTTAQQAMACGVAVTMGHIWPAPFGFRGGKGAATLLGVYAWIVPWSTGLGLMVFALVVLITGYASVATVLAAVTVCLHVAAFNATGVFGALGAFSFAMLVLVVWTHRDNLRRALRGEENQFQRARLIGNRLDQRRNRRP